MKDSLPPPDDNKIDIIEKGLKLIEIIYSEIAKLDTLPWKIKNAAYIGAEGWRELAIKYKGYKINRLRETLVKTQKILEKLGEIE